MASGFSSLDTNPWTAFSLPSRYRELLSLAGFPWQHRFSRHALRRPGRAQPMLGAASVPGRNSGAPLRCCRQTVRY